MVNGLARCGDCLRHDLWVKCVDVSLFEVKSDYSPMTKSSYQAISAGTDCFLTVIQVAG